MTCFTLIGGCRSLVMGWRREEHTLAVSWPSHSQTRNGKHHDKWEQEWEASSLPILSSWSHKIQVVIRFLKAFGMAQIDFLLYWKKNALQGWNSTFLLQPQRKMYLKKVLALCLWRKHCAEECSEWIRLWAMGSLLLHPTKANSSLSVGAEPYFVYPGLILRIIPQFSGLHLKQTAVVRRLSGSVTPSISIQNIINVIEMRARRKRSREPVSCLRPAALDAFLMIFYLRSSEMICARIYIP